MFWTNIKRVVRAGFVSFWRNGFVSLTSVLMMTETLFVIGSVIFVMATLDASLNEIQSKVDINVYMTMSAPEDQILALKKTIENLPEVKSVVYISQETALQNFKDRHADNASMLSALEEVAGNPLSAVLNVLAKDPGQYETIAKFLQSPNALSQDSQSIVRKINNEDNKTAIDVLSKIIDSARTIGWIVILLLVVISVLIIFNTVRLAIYSARDEISVMRLVGASNKYVRGPFVISGVMYGTIAGIIVLIIFYPLTYWLGPSTVIFGGINIYSYYIIHFGEIFGIIMGSGIVLGAVSSYLAVRRYLTI